MEYKGWMNKVLRIDLSSGAMDVEPLRFHEEYVGGRGLGVRYMAEEVMPQTEPLSPENKVMIATGPLTGTRAPTGGRFSVISRSPLTGTMCDSNSGGFFGAELKKAGYDAVIIEGESDKPVYLHIEDDKVELLDARDLWGKDFHETLAALKEKHEKHRVLGIGPAGENLVKVSAIMNDEDRAAGRGGLAAVLGSKKFKAIAVKGSKKVEIADPDGFDKTLKTVAKLVKKNGVTNNALPIFGTSVLVNIINAHGMFPTHNFQRGVFNDAEGISGEKIAETILTGKYACYGCPIACGRRTKTSNMEGEGPEYETTWAFGADLGINDLETVAEANYLCNQYGLDTISSGATIACAMELKEKGKLSSDEVPGFGEKEGLLALVKNMALRQGIGDELAEGSKIFAEKRGAPELAMQVKGMELPAYDPRGVQGMALSYATSNRGGCHMRAYMISPEILGQPVVLDRFSTEGKADVCIFLQNMSAFVDSVVMCRFTQFAFPLDYYSILLTNVTGKEYKPEDANKIGEKIWNLERLYNLSAGFTCEDDTLPPRFLNEELPEGGSRNRVVQLDKMLKEYYKLRGWDEKGIPTSQTMSRLGL